MDGRRFDAIIADVGRIASRRGAIKALIGSLLGGIAVGLDAEDGLACRIRSRTCAKHRQCCSRRCMGKKDDRRCRCSKHGKRCKSGADCCGFSESDPICETHRGCYVGKRCCQRLGALCGNDCDCGGGLTCGPFSECE